MKSQLRPIALTSWPTASSSALLGVVLTSVALLLTPCTILGQNRQNPQSDLDSFMDTLTERLVLSEAQVAQVRPIMEEQFQRQRELVQRYRNSGDPAESQQERDRLQQATHERLTNVLTERQMSEYHAMRQEQQRAQGQDCRCGHGQCGPGQCGHHQCGHRHGGQRGGCKRG